MIEKNETPALDARQFENSSRGIGSYEIHSKTKPQSSY
jgi:hypothetical protein